MKAIVENGVVVALVSGDVDGGQDLGADSTVVCGWGFSDGKFFPPVILSDSEKKEVASKAERRWRDDELEGTQWLVSRYREEVDLGVAMTLEREKVIELLSYRQMLRDWPSSEYFPETTKRPVFPDWLSEVFL